MSDIETFNDIEVVDVPSSDMQERISKISAELKESDLSDSHITNDEDNIVNEEIDINYPFSVNINNRILHFRKWKVKDKKKLDTAQTTNDIKQVLVYDCIKEDCVLDLDEYNYMLFKIRLATLPEEFTFSYTCPECGTEKKIKTELLSLAKIVNADFNDIIFKNDNCSISIQLTYPLNKEVYEKLVDISMKPFQLFINDFICHIKTVSYIGNGNETVLDNTNIDVLVDFIYNLDSDVAEYILSAWENQRFKFAIEDLITCDVCQNQEYCDFSNIPQFFPKSWRI